MSPRDVVYANIVADIKKKTKTKHVVHTTGFWNNLHEVKIEINDYKLVDIDISRQLGTRTR